MPVRLLFGVLALLGAVVTAHAQDTPPPDPELALTQIEDVLAAAERHLGALDQLITEQDEKLDTFYDQRDAAEQAGEADKAAQLGGIIDRMNLTLTNLEGERDRIAQSIVTLRGHMDVLRAAEPEGDEG
ncbi:DUF1664 domain-containing protein [Octadecabacter sp. G9-8]|uniref:DUF1664 domain-containing protein n=1 Tax=Octadecabacter dasysiphoniae TaxID=2909341 RepID=A0ABS9CZ26_9RHOB|nr:DUF1664 domain-containing protein [Octadecabacter dasysiphoniae]MCF2872047.1 DUF1664 domain-containing protein [Octadecabacter dasysiphoniae]